MKLLLEMRRRQMFRLIGLYIVGAWVVIQVADIAFPTWGIPDSAMRYLFLAALLCLPIALVFGWIFDIRSDGIYRTRKAGPDEVVDTKARWQDYLILVALAGVGVFIALSSMDKIRMESEEQPVETTAVVERHENGVAVLPFENLDPNPETGYFSDGVADEILSSLSNIRTLFVVGRASSFAFRQSGEEPAEIAGKLGVRYLLSGTVRRDGELVRVTARLLDDQGAHVWSQTFDRKLEKIFSIQSEIANAVSRRVAHEMSPSTPPTPSTSTDNIEAYRNYLLGKQLFTDRSGGWLERAPGLFQKAIELDPNFAPPYAYLVISQSLFNIPEDRLRAMEAATRKALELDANLPEAHLAMGLLHNHRDQDPDAAIGAFRRAVDLDPGLWIANNFLANALDEEERFIEAHEVREQGLARDPLNPALMVNVANDYAARGEFERAQQLMLRLLTLPQKPQFAYQHLRGLYASWGKVDESITWAKREIQEFLDALQQDPVQKIYYGWNIRPGWYAQQFTKLATSYAILGMEDHAMYWLELARKTKTDVIWGVLQQAQFCALRNDRLCLERYVLEAGEALANEDGSHWGWPALGQWHIALGNAEMGIEYLGRRIDIDTIDELDPDHVDFYHYMARALQLAGRADDAEQLLSTVGSWLETLVESLGLENGTDQSKLAVNRWLRGNREGAVEAMRKAIDAGWVLLHISRHDPLLGELLALPELKADLADVEKEIQRQRASVETAESSTDFREEVTRGLAALERYLAESK
jgi:TolB-like protein/tetratricopeptide (TPR) repeat protein